MRTATAATLIKQRIHHNDQRPAVPEKPTEGAQQGFSGASREVAGGHIQPRSSEILSRSHTIQYDFMAATDRMLSYVKCGYGGKNADNSGCYLVSGRRQTER